MNNNECESNMVNAYMKTEVAELDGDMVYMRIPGALLDVILFAAKENTKEHDTDAGFYDAVQKIEERLQLARKRYYGF